MNKLLILITVLSLWLMAGLAVAKEKGLSDREMIEGLIRLEEGQKRLEEGQKNILREMDKRFESMEKRFDQLISIFIGIVAAFAGIVAVTIGFAIWDRKMALAPALKRSGELEEREARIERVLKEYAEKEPRLAEILRRMGVA